MIDQEGVVPAAAPDAQPEEPVKPPFDDNQPRVFERVTLKLDRERPLHFTFKALRLFEERTGVSGFNEEKIWAYPWDLKIILPYIWAGLLEDDPSLTVEQLEELDGMEYGNIIYFRRQCQRCWGQNAPPPEPKTNGKVAGPNAQAHRTGSS